MFPYIRVMAAYVNIRSNPEVCSALFSLLASSNPQLFSTKGFNFQNVQAILLQHFF